MRWNEDGWMGVYTNQTMKKGRFLTFFFFLLLGRNDLRMMGGPKVRDLLRLTRLLNNTDLLSLFDRFLPARFWFFWNGLNQTIHFRFIINWLSVESFFCLA